MEEAPPKVEEEEKLAETPKAVVPDPTNLQDGWTKVPEMKKQAQVSDVRGADWIAEVLDIDKFVGGITDPNRAAISAVVQFEDGDAWLELGSLVAIAEGGGQPSKSHSSVAMDR